MNIRELTFKEYNRYTELTKIRIGRLHTSKKYINEECNTASTINDGVNEWLQRK